MKALSSLSKFVGCYDRWRNIITNYQLKWSNDNNLNIFKNILIDHDKSYDSMLEWLRKIINLPNLKESYRNILLFTTLTGLRQLEALQSIKKIKDDSQYYISKNTMLLEHFRFPHFFFEEQRKHTSVLSMNLF
jgi:hypothetical protein